MTNQNNNLVKTHGLTVKIREKCLDAGLKTAYQLQTAANLAPSVAQNLFSGNFSEISLQTLEKLLEALNCTAADIFIKEKSDLQRAKEILQTAKRILILTGAGVSAESNVPTFRGGGAGVWRGMPFEQLSSKQMVEENLPLVWEWFDYRRGVVAECEPNAAHRAIADWQRAGDFDEFTLVTQNIDGLHRRAGSTKVLELHGNIWRARCQMCSETFDVRDIPNDERPPVCKLCGDFLRPNVVLFGETLPPRILENAMERAKSCDVCLVVGTTSLVYPAASLPQIARESGAKIIEINPEPTALTESADVSIRGKAGEILPQLSPSIIRNLDNSDEYVSQAEAAKLRGVSRQRIGQLVKSGRLKTVGEGHDVLIRVEDLMNLTEGKRGRPRKAEESQINTTTQTAKKPNDRFTYTKENSSGLIITMPNTKPTKKTKEDFSETDSMPIYRDIPNEKLTEDDVPTSTDGWEKFALTFYADVFFYDREDSTDLAEQDREITKLAKRGKEIYEKTGNFSDLSLDELRASLFSIQRVQRWNMDSGDSDGAFLEFIEKILDEIRLRVKNKTIQDAQNSSKNLWGDDGFVRDDEDETALDRAWVGLVEEEEAEMDERRNFLLYWNPEGVEAHRATGENLDFVASNKLDQVEEGDVLLVVTVNASGELLLVGRVSVEEVADYQRVKDLNGLTDIEQADFYAIANLFAGELLKINLSEIIGEIRFVGGGEDQLKPENGRINPQQLAEIRELTPETAELLHPIWRKEELEYHRLKYLSGDNDSSPETGSAKVDLPKAARRDFGPSKERVLVLASEGGGLELFRFKADDGKYYFYSEGNSISLDDDDNEEWIEWQTEPVDSFAAGVGLLKMENEIFMLSCLFFHSEYRAELETYLKNLYAGMSDEERNRFRTWDEEPMTPEKWIARADEQIKRKAESEDFWRKKKEAGRQNGDDAGKKTLSGKHFLIYWQERNVDRHAKSDYPLNVAASRQLVRPKSDYPLDVVASRQLERAKAGDTLWLVTINQAGRFILVGRLKIGEIVDYQTAIKRLNDTNLWDSGFFALAKETEAEDLRRIILVDRALALRFAGSESDRFVLENGKINPQQLETMRELTADSAEMLTRIWQADKERDVNLHNVEFFRQLIREDPLDLGCHFKLGFHCSMVGLLEEANAAYRKIIESDPDWIEGYVNLGDNYLRAGDLDKARQEFETALRLAPESASLRFVLGTVYAEMRDYEKAIYVTKQGLEYDPNVAAAYFNVGTFYFHLQNYEKAGRWLEKSAEIDESDNPKTFYQLGKCYRRLGKKQKEFDAYRKAIEKDPDFLDALFALGTVYAHLTESTEGEQVNYFEPGKWFLSDPRISFYLGLGNLALDNIDDARVSVIDLRKMDVLLAAQLQFFIDRYVPEDESGDDSEDFDLQWLEPEESGFDIRVLDCRPFTGTRVAYAADEQNALTFLSTRESDGKQHLNESPDNALSFSSDLSYPINALIYSPTSNRSFETRDLPEGNLFSSAEMEEKWDVYYFDKYFYFVRSWTDKIAYRARTEEVGLFLNITEIEYDGKMNNDKDHHLRTVDFLVKTFVIGLTVPHPVPADIENTPESIALFSFSFAGRHAEFASFEDTISAIPTLQTMDYVGAFDEERMREYEEQKESKATTAASKRRELIEIFIDEQSFETKNIPQLYKSVLQYLVDTGKLENVSIPISTGDKRYILAKEPVHPTGKSFLASVEYKGFFMEAHNNREAAIAQLKKMIESVGCTFTQSSEFITKKDTFNNLKRENQHVRNDADVIRECIKTERGTDFTRIKVWHVVGWESHHNPITDWTIAGEIRGNPSQSEIDERIMNVLNDERYFGICSDCHTRLDRAWMLGSWCSECAWQKHGIIS